MCDPLTVWYPDADSENLADLYSGRKDIGMPEQQTRYSGLGVSAPDRCRGPGVP